MRHARAHSQNAKYLFCRKFSFWDLLQFCMPCPTKGIRKLLDFVTSWIGEKQLGLVSLFLRPLTFHILSKCQRFFVHELKDWKTNLGELFKCKYLCEYICRYQCAMSNFWTQCHSNSLPHETRTYAGQSAPVGHPKCIKKFTKYSNR